MGDHATTTNPNETAFADKGKGKAQDPTHDQNMESDSESESEPELVSLRNPSTLPSTETGTLTETISSPTTVRTPPCDLVCRHTESVANGYR